MDIDQIFNLIEKAVAGVMSAEDMPLYLGGALAIIVMLFFLAHKSRKNKSASPDSNANKKAIKAAQKKALAAAKAASKARGKAKIKAPSPKLEQAPEEESMFQLEIQSDFQAEPQFTETEFSESKPAAGINVRIMPPPPPPEPMSKSQPLKATIGQEVVANSPRAAVNNGSHSASGTKVALAAVPMRPPRPVAADQTVATPIHVDQTQLPTTISGPGGERKPATIQELDVGYDQVTFLSPLEITYYKLLRAAAREFLVFPRVISRSVVKPVSKYPDHLKVAENVLNSTSVSFALCDAKLNIRAIIELVNEEEIHNNKHKARDYIIKKSGLNLIRYYSGDPPPDEKALRNQILGI